MEKGNERKSTLYGNIREKLPPAESSFCERVKEVHPGADFVSVRITGSRIRFTCVKC